MKKIFIALLATIFTFSAQARPDKELKDNDINIVDATQKGWNIRIGAGYLLGGTAPLPIPVEIRGINGFNPGLNLSLEGSVEKKFNNTDWGLKFGVRFDTKGMTTDAKTKNYYMEVDGGKIKGVFTGNVKTHVNNTYLSVPVLATYSINNRWTVGAGLYASYLLKGTFDGEAYNGYLRDQKPTGEKTEVGSALYEFSNDLQKFHWGIQVEGEYKIYSHLAVFANLQWGMNGIFPKGYSCVPFALTPIYGTLGFNYIF
ncbi:MAG: PorT family protein [Bacteroidaceae bacterium]|nr:PorT family protein [Bacteroidaceae bacterium]